MTADSLQPRGRLKARRVQRRWGVRQKLQRRPEEPGAAEEGGSQEEDAQQQERQQRRQQQQQQQQPPDEQPGSEQEQRQPHRKRPRVALGANPAAADGSAERQPAAGSAAAEAPAADAAAAAVEAGDVELPVVPGVPPGLMQQLALLPGGRPPCGRCSACAAAASGGTRGCRTAAALKRWDALLPGLAMAEVQQLPALNRRCGRCRTCLLVAYAGSSGRARSSGASCMALSRVRVGQLQAQLRKLRQERQQWVAAQSEARQQQQQQQQQEQPGAASDSDAPGGSGTSAGSDGPSSSDSEGSNRSRAWMRDQRRRKRAHLQPLPAPDGSLPLPYVPGVPWERLRELAAAWGGGEAAPQRCGACADCRAAEGEAQEGGAGGSQHPRCAAVSALVAWDRQLGPVTAAAVRGVAALPAAEQRAAWCGSCRQCRRAPEGRQQPCATGEPLPLPALLLLVAGCRNRGGASPATPSPFTHSHMCPLECRFPTRLAARRLAAGKLPPRLQEAAAAAAAAEQAAVVAAADADAACEGEAMEAEPQPASREPSLQRGPARSSHDAGGSGGGSAAPSSSERTHTWSGLKRSSSQRSSSRHTTTSGSGSSDGSSSSSGSGSSSDAEPFSSSGGGSSDSEDDARWLPWVRSYLPEGWQQPSGAGGGSGEEDSDDDAPLAAARALLRRQHDREARYGPRGVLKWERGLGGWDSCAHMSWPDRRAARRHQLALMEAAARCLAAVRRVGAAWRASRLRGVGCLLACCCAVLCCAVCCAVWRACAPPRRAVYCPTALSLA